MTARLFGKLPAHGDFVARGLTASMRTALDDWLSRSLADAREIWADDFAERFDRALPWRCGGAGVAGAIAASQDAAGRRYPVLVLTAGDADQGERCETLLYAAIAERWDADRLVEAVGGAPQGEVEYWIGETERRLEGAMPAKLLCEMLA